MWKPNQPAGATPTPNEPTRPAAPSTPVFEPTPTSSRTSVSASSSTAAPSEQATIGKSLIIKGELTGSESLYIDGKVEGSITLDGNRVTIGRNGQVHANISAREVVVLGKVKGNIHATDRVDIRADGALTGDVIAQRISIEDGAFFKGGIDIRKPGTEKVDGKATLPLTNSVDTARAETARVANA